jgi:isochorismate synthase EntC
MQTDTTALTPTAVVALNTASSDANAAMAAFYLAVAAALAPGNHQQSADVTLARARQLDPEQTISWIARLAEIGQRHPTVLPLISALTLPPNPEDAGAA